MFLYYGLIIFFPKYSQVITLNVTNLSETNNTIFFKRPSFPLPLDGLQVNHLLFLIGKQKTEIQIIELVEKSLGNDTTKFLKKSKTMT